MERVQGGILFKKWKKIGVALSGASRLRVVLVHGFAGAPVQMIPFARHLELRGFKTHNVRLAGHGTSVEDLDRTTHHDWIRSVEQAVAPLLEAGEKVVVVGHSTGGAIALEVACRHPVSALVLLAAPVLMWPFLPELARMAGRRFRVLRNPFSRANRTDPPIGYPEASFKAVQEFFACVRRARGFVGRVPVPALLFHSVWDYVVPVASSLYLRASLPGWKRLVLFRSGFHLIHLERVAPLVFQRATEFLEKVRTGEFLLDPKASPS